jgi:hypothetical protein
MTAWLLLATELELPDFSSLYKPEMATMPAAPYVKLLKGMLINPMRVPFCQLSDGDLAVVAADPARTQRYTELVTHSVAPALRRIVQTVAIQVRCGRDFPEYEVHGAVHNRPTVRRGTCTTLSR